MERIAPKDRFSRHESSTSTPTDLVRSAIAQYGLNPDHCSIELLSGGFMNANFKISCGEEQLVFRVYSSDRATAERELDLLRFLKQTPVLVPATLALLEIEDRPIGVIEYFDGMTLEDRILSDQSTDLGLYEEIGNQLALIHQIKFQDAGFIGPRVTPGREYENFGAFIRQFIEKTLSWLRTREDRLDLETNARLLQLVQEQWHLVMEIEPVRQLVHCDFNPKNILVSRGPDTRALAIIDWEFCVSGNGLGDFGNFFRFAYDYPPEARSRFVSGYRAIHPELPPNWDEVSLLLDLGNMCSFLERREDYPKSFRTARAVIHSTLAKFGY